MDMQSIATMFHMVANGLTAGAVTIVIFIGIIGYMKYSAGKDRTRHGRQVFSNERF